MSAFAEYSHTIVSIAVFALMTLLLAPLSAARKQKEGLVVGSTPAADYGNPTYRWYRAHLNASETIGVFTGVAVAAMLAGASPFWVNLAASLFLASRIGHAIVHVAGIGRPDFGPRSILYTVGWLMCIVLAVLAVLAAFSGAG